MIRGLRFVSRQPFAADDVAALKETRLAIRAQAGDPRALDELCRRSAEFAYRLLRRTCSHEDAEDLAQDAAIAVAGAVSRYERRPGATFRAVIVTIVRNLPVSRYRRQDFAQPLAPEKLNAVLEVLSPPSEELGGGESFGVAALNDGPLRASLARLPRAQFQTVALRQVLGFEIEAIAALLDRSPSAVRRLHSRALGRLRAELRPPSESRRQDLAMLIHPRLSPALIARRLALQ